MSEDASVPREDPLAQVRPTPACAVRMSDDIDCGRPFHQAGHTGESPPVCLMHSNDPNKDAVQFASVITAIRTGACPYHRPKDRFDFSRFVFPEAMFSRGSSDTRSGLERVATFIHRLKGGHVRMGGITRLNRADQLEETDSTAVNGRVATKGGEGVAEYDNLDETGEPAFTRDVDFSFAVFLGPAQFVDMSFTGRASFAHARFEKSASFYQARFRRRVDFEGATFVGQADFYNGSFDTAVRFTDSRFQGAVRFAEVVFNFNTYFGGTEFAGLVTFWNASFNAAVQFEGAKLGPKVDFTRTLFRQSANFTRASFSGEAIFDRTLFSKSFPQRGHDLDIPETPLAPEPVVANFTGATFEQPSQVRFRRVNQENPVDPIFGSKPEGFRVRFVECDVSAVQFDAVHWHRKGKRMVLEDESDVFMAHNLNYRLLRNLWNRFADRRKIPPEERHELISLSYQQLVRNFEKVSSYDLAEDCYCGSMEMIRLDPERPVFVRAILTLYRLASDYGSNYIRAFGVLLGLIVLIGLVFALPWAGLARVAASSSGDSQLVTGWHLLPAGLFHTLEIGSFQRDTLYLPTSIFGRLISIITVIVLPSQLALFLLALRRRFRR